MSGNPGILDGLVMVIGFIAVFVLIVCLGVLGAKFLLWIDQTENRR